MTIETNQKAQPIDTQAENVQLTEEQLAQVNGGALDACRKDPS